jgi:two-component system NtrC family sensor kinase
VRANPTFGFVNGRSAFDGIERTFAYRKLPKYDALISTSFAKPAVIKDWMSAMSRHLIFGVPATIAMFGLSLMALRRTQRLQEEIERREATEQALRQAQKMEAVGRLSGGIAHDFNNMLTIILGNIDISLQRLGDANPRIERALKAARTGSERAATLVQRLLAFSRQHPLEVKAVDTNRLVQEMSEMLRRTLGETVAIETVLAGGLWRVATDPNQLENALVNLAVNARDAMPEGGRLTIETSNAYLDETYVAAHGSDIAHGQYVMIAVSDTGTGMNREVVDKAFEPFFTTKPVGMGTGLGLSMVYGFAKQSGGHIKIYSEPGEGTTIKLYFPRATDTRDLPEWSVEERSAPRARPKGGTETVLLVEDDQEVQRFASETLRDLGYTVHTASEGAAALKLLASEPNITLLFTDVILPNGMNGRQLADEARRRQPTLRVLYATGYTRNAIIHHGRLDADVELLTKPFSAEALARKVRQILDASSVGAESAPAK